MMNIFKKVKQFSITTLIGGLVVMLPLAIFVALISLMWNFLQNILQPVTDYISTITDWSQIIIDTLAVIGLLLLCFSVGLIVKTQFGKSIFAWVERGWLLKLPFYGTIKETVQQFSGAKEMPFKKVVLVDVFNTGTRMTGFVTDRLEGGEYTVFVPTGPNPTNGFIFHVKSSQITELDSTTEEAMRSVIGIGVGSNKMIKKL